MKPNFEQLVKSWQELRLTAQEKNVMRHNIWRRVGLDQPLAPPQHHWWSLRWQMYQHFAMVTVLVVGIISGGGLSLAAESALPGNLLYPLKTKVNEPIVAWLAPTPVSKIWWQTEVINRRLVEGEQLLAYSQTRSVAVQGLTRELTNRIDDLERDLNTLETENAVTVIKNVRNKIEQELLTHAKSITDTVVATKNSRPSVEQSDLDQAVRQHVETLTQLKQTISTAGSAAAASTTQNKATDPTVTPAPEPEKPGSPKPTIPKILP